MKLFSEQFRECGKNGIRFEEKCPQCNRIVIMCRKYAGICISYKCKEERGIPNRKVVTGHEKND